LGVDHANGAQTRRSRPFGWFASRAVPAASCREIRRLKQRGFVTRRRLCVVCHIGVAGCHSSV
jgi:hypothetical protein